MMNIEATKREISRIADENKKTWKGFDYNLVLASNSERERQVAAKEIAEYLYQNKYRTFTGLDKYLYYKLSGSLEQMIGIFEKIDNSAVYTNEYEGIVIIDISALSKYPNEYQVDYLKSRLTLLCQNTTIIISYNPNLGESMMRVLDKITCSLGKYIECKPDRKREEKAKGESYGKEEIA